MPLLRDGAGLLFPLGDVDALANAMRTALSDPKKMAEFARRSRERIGDYDTSRVIAMHDELYAGLVAGRSAAEPSVGD